MKTYTLPERSTIEQLLEAFTMVSVREVASFLAEAQLAHFNLFTAWVQIVSDPNPSLSPTHYPR